MVQVDNKQVMARRQVAMQSFEFPINLSVSQATGQSVSQADVSIFLTPSSVK